MAAKECGVYTKSSVMLGLGETDDEIIDTMLDLKDAGKVLCHECKQTCACACVVLPLVQSQSASTCITSGLLSDMLRVKSRAPESAKPLMQGVGALQNSAIQCRCP